MRISCYIDSYGEAPAATAEILQVPAWEAPGEKKTLSRQGLILVLCSGKIGGGRADRLDGVLRMDRLLVIDNYDSFTFNLVQMFRQYPLEIQVYRNDELDVEQAEALEPDYILISPGPRTPVYAGVSIPLIQRFYTEKPILGVCLGMQCINELFDGETVRAPLPVHGKTTAVHHDGRGIFREMPDPFIAARYHSLIIRRKSDELIETAHTDDGIVMGIEHREFPLYGVQFHPESFMTESGFPLVENFLKTRESAAAFEVRREKERPS